jgi:hypothetical protein
MGRRDTLTRAEAAAILGLHVDAAPDDVRHAWRMWARIAHPDVGGDPANFARLDQARRVLMQPRPTATPISPAPAPRPSLSTVVRPPKHLVALLVTALFAAMLGALPALVSAASGSMAFAAAATPAAIAAAAWAAWMTRAVVTSGADHGHRIMVLTLAWLPLAVLQQVTALAAGASLLPVLPLVAVPLAAAASAINPGAGLWRPVGRPSQ